MNLLTKISKKILPSDESKPFKLSRSKIDLFLQCKRCFYLDRKLGISQPSGAPFTLNNAVDALLKREFDGYRQKGEIHPFVKANGINAVPFAHLEIENWRNNKKGIRYLHKDTNFEIYGAIDDVWQRPDGELIIVDYKAKASADAPSSFLKPKTKKDGSIVKTEKYKISYKKQVEIYQWLFRKNGFNVSNTAYFIFANARKDKEAFNDRLDFEKVLIPYQGNDSWIEITLFDIQTCLRGDNVPTPSEECDFCQYWAAVKQHVDRGTSCV